MTRFVGTLCILLLSSCVATLTEQQRLSGTYKCVETGDTMIFRPDGTYSYTVHFHDKTLWDGTYCYDSPDAFPNRYNLRGAGLRFTYALSGHCFPDGEPLWGSPFFTDSSRETLQMTSLGRTIHYHRLPTP